MVNTAQCNKARSTQRRRLLTSWQLGDEHPHPPPPTPMAGGGLGQGGVEGVGEGREASTPMSLSVATQ